jgi:rhodanese-related sulfurtransferase
MSVNVTEAEEMMKTNQNNPAFKVIDVRTGMERWMSRIPNSEHVPLSDLESRLNEFNKNNTYLIYCRSGARSQSATNTLTAHGINAINLSGGINSWGNRPTEGSCEIY